MIIGSMARLSLNIRKKVIPQAIPCLSVENLCDSYLHYTNLRAWPNSPLSPPLVIATDSFPGRCKKHWIQTRSGMVFYLKQVVMSVVKLEHCYKVNTLVQVQETGLE